MDREIKELEQALEKIWDIALNKFKLDPFPVHFEIVPATVMYEIGSYALPGRYSHWTFGKAYHRMKTMYDYGLSRIYEVVINTNPSYGFLLETNSPLQNKLVMAHVLGHVDFFKNNAWFSRTNRRMVDEVSAHAARIDEYEFTYGRKTVEAFLDSVLSIEEHVDPDFFIKKERDLSPEQRLPAKTQPGKFDDLLTPEERKKTETPPKIVAPGTPLLPEKDLVWFIANYSPTLEPWQRDIMNMVHQEMLYFVPQMQTKTINEGWACAVGETLLLTEEGFIRFDQLYESGARICVASGGRNEKHPITAFHKEENVLTIRVKTRRGLIIEGSAKHRIFLNGDWVYLKDVKVGDKLPIEYANNVWPAQKQKFNFPAAQPSPTLYDVASTVGVSYTTVVRHLQGLKTRKGEHLQAALQSIAYRPGFAGKVLETRAKLKIPLELDENMAWLLGYFIGDGNKTKSGICLTCGESELAEQLKFSISQLFGLSAKVFWDPTNLGGQGGRWRVVVHSRELLRFLRSIGLNLEDKARTKKIPSLLLRSPKEVIAAFLRGYFDADGYAGKAGVILSSASEELIRTVQVILLNFGVLSWQRPQTDGCTHLAITSSSAELFEKEIGFGLKRKKEALRKYIENRQWFKKEEVTDSIVSIEHGQADVYDITVDSKHAYVANGILNHNSIIHSRIMRELDLSDSEHVEFAELHASVVSPHKGQLNPYFVGYKILEDIERRWNHPTKEEQEKFGRVPGEGWQKLLEVREVENDISLLRNYLTEDLCEELDLYVFELVDDEDWTITEKRWERVRDQLVASKTNFGFPYIEVTDADYNGNRELYLTHRFEGSELDLKYARKVLEYVQKLWGRTVHLETRTDNDKLVLHYDGKEHDED
ncbi:MAG: SpoVR family protein [Blastocatellia bacterium]|nr:SpoVR family protein [Blastocatellia bacterium]